METQEMIPKTEALETFLQQKPTLVFGRNARELLILLCAGALSFTLWEALSPLQQPLLLLIGGVALTVLTLLLGALLAFVTVDGYYHLEDWLGLCFAYLLLPKLFLYLPGQDTPWQQQTDLEDAKTQQQEGWS